MDTAHSSLRTIDDPITRQPYEVYGFNEGNPGRPLLVHLGLGSTALTSVGRRYLQAYASAMTEPIYHFHTRAPLPAWSDFRLRAQSDIAVADAIGLERFNVTGISSGALAALEIASEVGDRAGVAVTVSAPGTMQGYLRYIRAMPKQLIDGAEEFFAFRRQLRAEHVATSGSSNVFNPRAYWELRSVARRIIHTSLSERVNVLSPRTYWADIVGMTDALTDYRDHDALVRRRNAALPDSSTLHVEPGQTHMWAARQHELAKLVAQAIEASPV